MSRCRTRSPGGGRTNTGTAYIGRGEAISGAAGGAVWRRLRADGAGPATEPSAEDARGAAKGGDEGWGDGGVVYRLNREDGYGRSPDRRWM